MPVMPVAGSPAQRRHGNASAASARISSLLDQTLPGESGLTMLRRLRLSAQLYDLPVIMFTALSGEADEAQAIFAGAQDFIRKPFDPVQLVRRVGRMIKLRGDRPRHVDLKTALAIETGGAPQQCVPMPRRVI